MESVDQGSTGQSEKGEQAKPEMGKVSERISINPLEVDKVERWLTQLRKSSSGFLNLSKSDLVNFVIRGHHEDLTPREIQSIREIHYDPIKHLNWITPKLKSAIDVADTEEIGKLQNEIRNIQVSTILKVPRSNKVRVSRRIRRNPDVADGTRSESEDQRKSAAETSSSVKDAADEDEPECGLIGPKVKKGGA